jgi:hypothetical protein
MYGTAWISIYQLQLVFFGFAELLCTKYCIFAFLKAVFIAYLKVAEDCLAGVLPFASSVYGWMPRRAFASKALDRALERYRQKIVWSKWYY